MAGISTSDPYAFIERDQLGGLTIETSNSLRAMIEVLIYKNLSRAFNPHAEVAALRGILDVAQAEVTVEHGPE